MAGLASKIEETIVPLNQVAHAVLVSHVGDIDPHPVFDAGDVEQVTAVFGDEAVHQGHAGAEVQQSPRQVRADEAEAARDEDSLVCEGVLFHVSWPPQV